MIIIILMVVIYFLYIKAELSLLDELNECFSFGTLDMRIIAENFISTTSLSASPIRNFLLKQWHNNLTHEVSYCVIVKKIAI